MPPAVSRQSLGWRNGYERGPWTVAGWSRPCASKIMKCFTMPVGELVHRNR